MLLAQQPLLVADVGGAELEPLRRARRRRHGRQARRRRAHDGQLRRGQQRGPLHLRGAARGEQARTLRGRNFVDILNILKNFNF